MNSEADKEQHEIGLFRISNPSTIICGKLNPVNISSDSRIFSANNKISIASTDMGRWTNQKHKNWLHENEDIPYSKLYGRRDIGEMEREFNLISSWAKYFIDTSSHVHTLAAVLSCKLQSSRSGFRSGSDGGDKLLLQPGFESRSSSISLI
jgi:hypothetical protein